MTRDDIIKMAKEAGFNPVSYTGANLELFERFAALVAAAEREACIKAVEKVGQHGIVTQCAAAIRYKKHDIGLREERDRVWTQAHWTEYERSIAAAEREACAKLCDEIAIDMWKLYKGRPPYKGNEEGRASDFTQGRSAGADDCADAIRRRTDAA